MKKVHIAMVGETTENIVHGVIQVGGSELFTIVSEKFKDTSVDKIRTGLPSVRIHRHIGERELIINPFKDDSFFQIVGFIIDIAKSMRQRKDAKLWVNITGGTNLMSAAAATGAMLTESKAYYVSRDPQTNITRIIEIPFLVKSFNILVNEKRKRIMQEIANKGQAFNDELVQALAINKKSISKHLKYLEANELIIRKKDGKHVINSITDSGKITMMLYKINSN